MQAPFPIKLLSLDLDNTLIDRDAAFLEGFECWLAAHPEYCRDRDDWVPLVPQWDESGRRPREAFCEDLARGLSVDITEARAIWEEIREAMIRALRPDPRVVERLSHWSSQTTLALVSNGSSQVQRAKIEAAGVAPFFTHIVISEEVGRWKPEPEIFLHLLGLTRVAPEEALHVGDDPVKDVLGARRAGMRTGWILNPGLPDPGADISLEHLTDLVLP